jgi:hypothetical protein
MNNPPTASVGLTFVQSNHQQHCMTQTIMGALASASSALKNPDRCSRLLFSQTQLIQTLQVQPELRIGTKEMAQANAVSPNSGPGSDPTFPQCKFNNYALQRLRQALLFIVGRG